MHPELPYQLIPNFNAVAVIDGTNQFQELFSTQLTEIYLRTGMLKY